MPPKRFEGKFGIPPSHPVESLLTQALYRLPETVSVVKIESLSRDIATRVNSERAHNSAPPLSKSEEQTLTLKLARHFEDNEDAAALDVLTIVDALVESPKFLQSDKGNMTKLSELHEMKTLQKIAELRRKRAEITERGYDSLNPYENLFETSSGKYYLTRLLNMPHLEEESEYMNHCVGTSTSYVNKMKRGEVEIFSFRDKDTQKPLVTIEYDTRFHTLLQVRAESDRIPTLADEFASDLIEALESLNGTQNDHEKPRKVLSNEARHLRTLLTLKEKREKKTPFTKDELAFLYEIDELIRGFDQSGREPLIAELRQGRNAEEDILVIFECTREEIAHVPSQINENTKVYVGAIAREDSAGNLLPEYLNIFHKFPATLEHIYTSFPDKKIRRENVEIGGKSAEQLISLMEAAGIKISNYAKLMLKSRKFVPGKNPEKVTLIDLTVGDLGLKSSATTDQIYERAQILGLELCPVDTGPNYRLEYRNQLLDEWIYMGMKQITDFPNRSHVFKLARRGDSLWLDGIWASPDIGWNQNCRCVFRLRPSISLGTSKSES